MRALLLVVFIAATLAEEHLHYPTNHPGVCNILAFVGEHVEEVVHVAHDEVEAVTDKGPQRARALIDNIQRVKRQVKDLMESAECLVTDSEKASVAENNNATSSLEIPQNPQQEAALKEIQRSVRDVVHLLQSSTTSKPQVLTENVPEPLTQQSADKQPVLQHVAEPQTTIKRLARDVLHVLQNLANSEHSTSDEVTQQNSKQHVTSAPDNRSPDTLTNCDTQQMLETLQQQKIEIQKDDETSKPNADSPVVDATPSSDHLSQKVAPLLSLQAPLPSHKENEVKVESTVQNFKSDLSLSIDILPEETQRVAVQKSLSLDDQLYPPTIGQPVDFQARLQRNAKEKKVAEDKSTNEKEQHVADAKQPAKEKIVAEDTSTNMEEQHAAEAKQSSDVAHKIQPIDVQQKPNVAIPDEQLVATQQNNVAVPEPNVIVEQQVLQYVAGNVAVRENRYRRNVAEKSSEDAEKPRTLAKRSPNESSNTLHQSQQNVDSNPDYKYIQIVKPRSASSRAKRSETDKFPGNTKTPEKSSESKPKSGLPLLRLVRSALQSIEKPKEIPTQPNVAEDNSQHVAKGDVLNKRLVRSTEELLPSEPLNTLNQKPLDLEEETKKPIRPSVRALHSSLPRTHFLSRKKFIKST